LDRIKKILYNSGEFIELNNFLNNLSLLPDIPSELNKQVSEIKKLFINGVSGSLISFIIDFAYVKNKNRIIFISYDIDKIIKIKEDLDLISDCENISIFSKEKKIDSAQTSKSLSNISQKNNFIVLLDNESFKKDIIRFEEFNKSFIILKKNSFYEFELLKTKLHEYNYNKNDFVEQPGDYSVRGGIIDIYPENFELPVRIEYYGNTIESIREFDLRTQRSIREIDEIQIVIQSPAEQYNNWEKTGFGSIRTGGSIIDYISRDCLVFIDEYEILKSENQQIYQHLINNNNIILTGVARHSDKNTKSIDFKSKPQPDFYSSTKNLVSNVSEYIKKNYNVFLLCSDEYQVDRLMFLIEETSLTDIGVQGSETSDEKKGLELTNSNNLHFIPESIHNGFIFPESTHSKTENKDEKGIIVYTEHQIFGRFFRQYRHKKRKFVGILFDDLKQLRTGDFIVHRDFGIGMYYGLKKIKTINGEQEVIKLLYGNGDILFLNLNYVNLIKKYSAQEGQIPKLNRLGGNEWEKLRQKTKNKVKDIARDLILLYAKRKSQAGYRFSADSIWQKELEANFIYEDTPDQITATLETKQDMESENPMDRLICGDVGFGKTEVALRAAFKSVLDNRQVALLVPTTILGLQHYNTFRDRLSSFAVEAECLTRLTKRNRQKEILKRLKEGKINILIGTHRILSNDVKFKDIGLLIIDEEQRFGVKAKEKLRSLKTNIDTLTLTATPIPRTLNFSLLGARDLSIINTPPKNRKPIITEIIKLDWTLLGDIVRRELDRKGQVYFVNDKIDKLERLAEKLKQNIPSAKIGIAHGQMNGRELENIIIDFIEKKFNVLVCTKIIESGLDIPNVNTIIINNANMFGLAELYQLRGRVGRADIQAYAYFISPPSDRLTKTAIRRLQAIEEYTELGSGFNLAMRDMEIRGVGNLLGKEQSGFVQQIGFETYIDIIEEAVGELKEQEFGELFKEKEKTVKQKLSEKDYAVIENDLNAIIPDDYIENDTERFNIYKRLYEAKDTDELETIREELRDRFGDFLDDVENLFRIVELKIKATETGLEKITFNKKILTLYFPTEKYIEKQDLSVKDKYKTEFFDRFTNKISTARKGKFLIRNNKEKLIIDIELEDIDDTKRLDEAFYIVM